MSGWNPAVNRELDQTSTYFFNRALDQRGCIVRNADTDFMELLVSIRVLVAHDLRRIPEKRRECVGDVRHRVVTVIRKNTLIAKSAGDVVLVVEVEGGLEVSPLRQTRARAVLGPFVFPEIFVASRLAR